MLRWKSNQLRSSMLPPSVPRLATAEWHCLLDWDWSLCAWCSKDLKDGSLDYCFEEEAQGIIGFVVLEFCLRARIWWAYSALFLSVLGDSSQIVALELPPLQSIWSIWEAEAKGTMFWSSFKSAGNSQLATFALLHKLEPVVCLMCLSHGHWRSSTRNSSLDICFGYLLSLVTSALSSVVVFPLISFAGTCFILAKSGRFSWRKLMLKILFCKLPEKPLQLRFVSMFNAVNGLSLSGYCQERYLRGNLNRRGWRDHWELTLSWQMLFELEI